MDYEQTKQSGMVYTASGSKNGSHPDVIPEHILSGSDDCASQEPVNGISHNRDSETGSLEELPNRDTSLSDTAIEPSVLSRVSWPTYLLVCLFGIGSWVAINGMWTELPVLVNHVPEQWSLPSYLTVIVQLANIGPLAYSIGNSFAPKVIHERPVVYLLVFIGFSSCILLAIFWNKTSFIFGAKRSTALIVLVFFVSVVDCTTTVVFLPFMSIFPDIYMSALYTGESLSGLLPSLVALGQGIDKPKTKLSIVCEHDNNTCHNVTSKYYSGLNFSPNWFFVFLSTMMIVCGFAFTAINFLPSIKRIHVKDYSSLLKFRSVASNKRTRSQEMMDQPLLDVCLEDRADTDVNCTKASCCIQSEENYMNADNGNHSFRTFLYLLVVQAWINCLSNGVVSQIQAYACEPYGTNAYHLAATLSGISSPLTCFAFMWVSTKSSVVISVCSFIYTLLTAYIIMLAAQSPDPILKGTTAGSFLVILAFVLSGVFVSYAKLAVCTVMRNRGHKALFWCGVAIQIGSFVGAIVMFPLVNVAKLFKQ